VTNWYSSVPPGLVAVAVNVIGAAKAAGNATFDVSDVTFGPGAVTVNVGTPRLASKSAVEFAFLTQTCNAFVPAVGNHVSVLDVL
jgi:hypothetical protein